MSSRRYINGESRFIHLMEEVGHNFGVWRDDVVDRYFKTPAQNKSTYEQAMGVVGAGVSTVTELPDYLISGAVDKRLEAARWNTLRDVGETIDDAVHLRPLKTAADVIRFPGSIARDAVVTVGGLRGSRDNFSSKMNNAVSAEAN